MSYPRFDAPRRTDNDFRIKRDADHHKINGLTRQFVISPLENLPIDMVKDFAIGDSLHLIDLGITKRLLVGWKSGGYNFKNAKLAPREINEISTALTKSNEFKPNEIHRAIRGMDSLAQWKGTEYRTFLLYLGPVILKDFLREDIYDNFMLYFCAITIISCDNHIYRDELLPLAEPLLLEFLNEYIDIYGIDAINNNLHNLCHLIDDVKRFGSLPRFSAYPFENKLGFIKHLLRSGYRPLAQVVKRLSEMNSITTDQPANTSMFPYLHKQIQNAHKHPANASCVAVDRKTYGKIFIADGVVIENNNKNQWFMTHDKNIVKMLNAAYCDGNICIYGSCLKKLNNFFDKPIESKYLDIYQSKTDLNAPTTYNVSYIKCKMFCLKYHDTFVFTPILHTLDVLNII